MDEINLDFLKTPPKHGENKRIGSPFIFNEFDVRFGSKKRSKKLELAKNIAKVDELVQQIDQLKNKNLELQQQLKGFQAAAQQVQELYIKEKNEHCVAKQDLEKLQKEHSKIDDSLANMTLVNEQLKARLDEYDGRPISFENLVVKYVKVMTKFQEDDVNKYSHDKDLLERLREYCTVMKYKVPRAISPKKSRPRGNKTQTRDTFAQCDLFGGSALKTLDCSACKSKPKVHNQSTQYSETKRDQASQYISTMVTRQTNTENVAQKHVQTMFPEPPAIDDILKVYAKWTNIRSVSPLMESPPRSSPPKELLKSQSTTGTCTMLCNIRRKIDYLPSNNSSNIKQELFTPSASPTPNTDSTLTNGSRTNSLFSLFNSTANSSLGQISFNAFNELWQIFGKMLLSLIQNTDTSIATANRSANINQQQFLDWLLELYTNSKTQFTAFATTHTQTLEQRDTNDSVSPLIFKDTSVLSANILRPQPLKPPSDENVDTMIENIAEVSSLNLINYNTNIPIASTVPSDISLKSPTNTKIQQNQQQQVTCNTNKVPTTNICETNQQEKAQNCNSQLNQKEKTKYNILDEMQELLPGLKLNKKKRKILKRLVKSNRDRKRFYEIRDKQISEVDHKKACDVIPTNDYSFEDATETAVDFLQTFAVAKQNNQPIEADFTETEKIFYKQVSSDKAIESIVSNAGISEKSNFIVSSSSLTHSSKATNGKWDVSKPNENKYQLLFGDSDSEEVENFEYKPKQNDNEAGAVGVLEQITQAIDESSDRDQVNYRQLTSAENSLNGDCNLTCPISPVSVPQEAFNIENLEQDTIKETLESSLNERCHITRNVLQSSLLISENPFSSSQEISIPDIPTPILKDLEYTCLPDFMQFPHNLQNLNSSSSSLGMNNNSFASDLELPSDVYCLKENNEMAANKYEATNESYTASNPQNSALQTVERTTAASFNPLPGLNAAENSEDRMESQPVIISSAIIYSSEFEKDFELSSDDESLSNETNFDSTPNVISAGNESNSLQKELTESGQGSNILLTKNKDNNSVNKFQTKRDGSSYLSPNKEQDEQKIGYISYIELSDSSELYNISEPSSNNSLSVENFEVGEETALSGHEENLKTSQTSCLLKSIDSNVSTRKVPIQKSKLKATANSGEKPTIKKTDTMLEGQNYGNEDYLHDKQIRSETKETSSQESNTSSLMVLSQTQYDSFEAVNSSTCSTITITDSSSNNEQIFKVCDKKDLPKISGQGSLKLLDLSKTLSRQKACNNFKSNIKENNSKNTLRDDMNRTETINSEENLSAKIDDKETVTIERKCVYPMNSKVTTENINEYKSKASVWQKLSNKFGTNEPENQEFVSESLAKKTTFEESFFTNIKSTSTSIQYEVDCEVDKFDLNDSLSMEDELMIDEEPNETTSKVLHNNALEISNSGIRGGKSNATLNSSNMSTLLNSSLYNEVLTESLKPIVNDLLQEDLVIVSATSENKFKRGRKRKSECLPEPQPCKRSQRLRAKQMILEESLNLSETPLELANALNGRQQKSTQKAKTLENENISGLGFFTERDSEDHNRNKKKKAIDTTATPELEAEFDKTYRICENNEELQKHETQTEISSEILSLNIRTVCEWQQDGQKCSSPGDCVNTQPSDNFIYTDSPQSPPPIDTHSSNHAPDKCVDIPLDRPIDFVPQDNNPQLFDTLMNSYRNEHQKQVLESISHKELKRTEHLLKQFKEHIILYCSEEMELDLYCTSTVLINKLLNLSSDYSLMQKAVIDVAQRADSPNVSENDLPSIIQEMPPRHLSKCLQRLFTFLRIIVTRNSSFCQELMNKIESLLFNPKQIENLSLQATLNLTQLFLMASKVQEYLQTPKHPARLFIAKCLYYYLQKSILMIHEVLLWYPTVLPHREDRTYDRSDALISVIQQILMNTKYDMDKTDLRGKLLISKLRYEYHFEPFRPTQDEVISVLVEKLKNSKFYNISLAFGLLCKRIGVIRTQNIVLGQHLMPLANEYYSLALKTNEFDKRIEVLLEIISMLVKPLPIETDTKKYFMEFARFLNGFERQVIQEAAVCCILRLQRFNVEYCYSLLSNFQPTYNLNAHTQAMLKTFLYRRPLGFWKNLKVKNSYKL